MKAVFLDRDGSLIVDPEDLRVDSIEEIELFPDSIEALRLLASLEYGVFIISNQAGIAEGRFTEQEFLKINDKVLEMVADSGAKILKTYYCPHDPVDNCECRKPKPGMLLQAAKEFNINLSESWMIGDRLSDIQAGVNAGTRTILVQTGNAPVTAPQATHTSPTLLTAINYIYIGYHQE